MNKEQRKAQRKIKQMAKDQGIRGVFKVFYKGQMWASPEDIPKRVVWKHVYLCPVGNLPCIERIVLDSYTEAIKKALRKGGHK